MLWRLNPMADPLVTEWHSRDLGSRISEREVSAVAEWLATNRNFHIMRDHPKHLNKINGCCFGMKISNKNSAITRSIWKELFEKMLVRSMRKWKKGLDQDMIEKVMWQLIASPVTDANGLEQTNLIVHDSYTCTHFKDKQPPEAHRSFPTRRKEDSYKLNFVGQGYGENHENQISLEEHGTCPMICRPQQHPDWILC